jgi:hypothetical protein
LGFALQITKILRWRRTILQCSQIRFTLERIFIELDSLSSAVSAEQRRPLGRWW